MFLFYYLRYKIEQIGHSFLVILEKLEKNI